jgi:hypothetical protein
VRQLTTVDLIFGQTLKACWLQSQQAFSILQQAFSISPAGFSFLHRMFNLEIRLAVMMNPS